MSSAAHGNGPALRAARKARSHSQEQCALALSAASLVTVSQSTVSRYERNEQHVLSSAIQSCIDDYIAGSTTGKLPAGVPGAVSAGRSAPDPTNEASLRAALDIMKDRLIAESSVALEAAKTRHETLVAFVRAFDLVENTHAAPEP